MKYLLYDFLMTYLGASLNAFRGEPWGGLSAGNVAKLKPLKLQRVWVRLWK
jgi:hypothetical protein